MTGESLWKNLLCLGVAGLLAACANPDVPKPQDQYELGMKRLAQGRHSQAMACFLDAGLQGHGPSQRELGYLFADGKGGVPRSNVLAYAWIRLAVHRGLEPTVMLGDLCLGTECLMRSEMTDAELREAGRIIAHLEEAIEKNTGKRLFSLSVSTDPESPPGER